MDTLSLDAALSELNNETDKTIEIVCRNTSTGAAKKISFNDLASLLYTYLTTGTVLNNMASVLGAKGSIFANNSGAAFTCKYSSTAVDFDTLPTGVTVITSGSALTASSNAPSFPNAGNTRVLTICNTGDINGAWYGWQIAICRTQIMFRYHDSAWGNWKSIV